jgi:hypothetical protein
VSDDLRTRLEHVLANTTASFVPTDFEGLNAHGEEHGGHSYHGACALCRGEIGTLLDAIMPVVEGAIRAATIQDCCGTLRYGSHAMACRLYAGVIDHWKVRHVDGDVTCSCGWPWPAFSEECHNSAETWRGPIPARDADVSS